jgi:hypothetical protein
MATMALEIKRIGSDCGHASGGHGRRALDFARVLRCIRHNSFEKCAKFRLRKSGDFSCRKILMLWCFVRRASTQVLQDDAFLLPCETGGKRYSDVPVNNLKFY